MIFATVPVAAADGAILAHSIVVDGTRWPKGRRLSPADVAAAAAAGLASLTCARLEAHDVPEDEAATMLAGALAGSGVTALPAAHGRANLAATCAGVLVFDPAAIATVNSCDEALTLATLPAHARVAAGEIVATIKVIRYAVAADTLATATKAARQVAVAPFRPLTVALLATMLAGTTPKAVAKAARVTRDRVEGLGCRLVELPPCPHETDAVTAALMNVACDLVLVIGASATVDRGDVIPAAIVAAGGRVERLGMPVDPGNLLCLGDIDGKPVIGLPGCARSPKRNGFDIVLERLCAGLDVTSATIAALGAGGLLPEAERPQPRAAAVTIPGMPKVVGAIVLAAGRSTRMGDMHKLLEPWRGKPLVAHVVDAIAAAGLPAPVVVLGARAAEVRAALGDRPAHHVVAPDHADGISRSLRAGLVAIPEAWDSALICLADMPRVDAATLAAIAGAPGTIVVPVSAGKRGNPVRWDRAHFRRLMDLAGDVGGKALLAEFADELTLVEVAGDAIFDDIDTPSALASLRAR